MEHDVTRGYGFLEGFLAKQRVRIANKLIVPTYRKGRILDIGCGLYPYFLTNTDFSEKYGLDKINEREVCERIKSQKINLVEHDIETEDRLPFSSCFFDVVVMLATLEHIEPKKLVKILREVNRILKDGGFYIITTPTAWTDGLLNLMAKLKLVSTVEIDDHKDIYKYTKILSLLEEAGFSKEKMACGYFEVFINIWVTVTK